jgi:microcystin-dependent protein
MALPKSLPRLVASLALVSSAPFSVACEPDGYLGTMSVFAGNFAIRTCELAQGQLLAINSNQALFSILGTTYGGDGRTTFALPDTRGRAVIGQGNGPGLTPIALGQRGGAESRTLISNNLPSHSHANITLGSAQQEIKASSSTAATGSPAGAVWAAGARRDKPYSAIAPNVVMADAALSLTGTVATATINSAGGSQPVNTRDPFVGMLWLIQTQGLFPPRN